MKQTTNPKILHALRASQALAEYTRMKQALLDISDSAWSQLSACERETATQLHRELEQKRGAQLLTKIERGF